MVSWTAAAGHGQPRDFSQAASDESGDGIVAKPQSVAHAGRDGDNVFQGSTEFDSDHIVVGIKPEPGIAEFALHRLRQLRIFRGDRDRGRIAARNFLGERRPAQRCDARRKPLPSSMTCAATSVMRKSVASSRPLVALTKSIAGFRCGSIC